MEFVGYPGVRRLEYEANIHLHLVKNFIMHRAVPHCPFIAWCLDMGKFTFIFVLIDITQPTNWMSPLQMLKNLN